MLCVCVVCLCCVPLLCACAVCLCCVVVLLFSGWFVYGRVGFSWQSFIFVARVCLVMAEMFLCSRFAVCVVGWLCCGRGCFCYGRAVLFVGRVVFSLPVVSRPRLF